jgi:hypothetical protein
MHQEPLCGSDILPNELARRAAGLHAELIVRDQKAQSFVQR